MKSVLIAFYSLLRTRLQFPAWQQVYKMISGYTHSKIYTAMCEVHDNLRSTETAQSIIVV